MFFELLYNSHFLKMSSYTTDSGGGPVNNNIPSPAALQAEKEKEAQQIEKADTFMRAMLSAEARERLKRIEVVKPERARLVSQHIAKSVQTRRLLPPVSDDTLKSILSSLSQQENESNGLRNQITFLRKTRDDDDW